MNSAQRSPARWFTVALGGVLLASALVVYALVRVTSPGTNGETPTEGAASSTTMTNDTEPGGTLAASDSTAGLTSATGSTASSTALSRSTDTTASGPVTSEVSVPPTTTSALGGSNVVLPAAWSGTAKVTVSVHGECASANPSVYSDIPADLALDLVQNEASVAETGIPVSARANDITLTLGVNPNGVPALAMYTSRIEADSTFSRYWTLYFTSVADRVEIHGQLSGGSVDGNNPNIMVDAETSLQSCESAGSVSLPRILARGATLDGWVSETHAELTLQAETTDHKRDVLVELSAERRAP